MLSTAGICDDPPHIAMADARTEAEHVLFTLLDALFAANPTIVPSSIDVLVCNCSLFCPTPSLTSLLVHRYHLSPHIQTYQLGGMGCSAGVIALHLARDLLQVRRNVRCIVVSTENITQNIYLGAQQPMLVSNALFRCGGAALLLTNRWSDRWLTGSSGGGSGGGGGGGGVCRFVLRWTSRTHMGWDDASYRCVYQMEDEYGHRGVRLGKDLMAVAARALRVHVSSIAHRLLPWSEIAKYGLFFLLRLVALRLLSRPTDRTTSADDTQPGGGSAAADESMDAPPPKTRPSLSASLLSSLHYTPSFSSRTVHPCVHAGGSGVLAAIQAALRLTDADMAVSRAVLRRYGNVSSASVFYELRMVDASRRRAAGRSERTVGEAESEGGPAAVGAAGGPVLRRGDSVWLLAFGSGFKVNSALFEAV